MLLALTLTVLNAAPDAGVSTIVWDDRSAVKLVEGQTVQLVLKKPLSRVAASNAAICDVQANKPTSLTLIAKKPGIVTIALWYGMAMKGVQVEVAPKQPVEPVAVDAGIPLFTWDGEHGLRVPRGVEFDVQGPGGLEKVAPGSHRRCTMSSIGNDQLRFRCAEAGPVTVFLWYANSRRRSLELDVDK